MCARFPLAAPGELLQRLFAVEMPDMPLPRFNIAPTQQIVAVREHRGVREAELMTWGLIPSWSKDSSGGGRLINARAETVTERPSFRKAFSARRCAIPCTGFIEWRHGNLQSEQADDAVREGQPSLLANDAPKRSAASSKTPKQPYLFQIKDAPVAAFAGIYELWKAPEDAWLVTCALLTTTPNEVVLPFHDRMPCLLRPEDVELWLEPEASREQLLPMLAPLPSSEITVRPVNPRLNNPRNEGADLLESVAS